MSCHQSMIQQTRVSEERNHVAKLNLLEREINQSLEKFAYKNVSIIVEEADGDQVNDLSDEQRLAEAEKRAHMLRLVMDIKKLQLMTAEAEATVRQLEETAAGVRNSGNRVRSAIQTRQVISTDQPEFIISLSLTNQCLFCTTHFTELLFTVYKLR